MLKDIGLNRPIWMGFDDLKHITPTVTHRDRPRPLSALLCRACISAAAGRGVTDDGRLPPDGVSSEELSIITSGMTAAEVDDDDDGRCIRGITAPPAAAATAVASIGGLEITDRLISSVSILSCRTHSHFMGRVDFSIH